MNRSLLIVSSALALALPSLACRDNARQRHDQARATASQVAPESAPSIQTMLETRAADLAAGMADPAGRADTEHDHGGPLFAGCPVADVDAGQVDALLDRASGAYRDGDFGVAYDCAAMAADTAPRSVEAHHLRAASAAALGHLETAQLAYTLALALDPDDPDTLAAAADFFINSVPRSSRESIMVGLEHARRGHTIATTRRSQERGLIARLTLLEAQALNDLGMSREALARADDSMTLIPRWSEAEHERGVALFNLCRFAGARDAFTHVITESPDDAYAHYYLGLIDERLGLAERSEHHFHRARSLAPGDFWAPLSISEQEFAHEVNEALTELPPELSSMLEHVAIEVVDLPSMDDLTAVEPPFSPTILGLFRGLPLGVEDPAAYAVRAGTQVPERAIVLYRMNLERIARTRAELDSQIRQTILHELGHLSGMDEDELRHRGLE